MFRDSKVTTKRGFGSLGQVLGLGDDQPSTWSALNAHNARAEEGPSPRSSAPIAGGPGEEDVGRHRQQYTNQSFARFGDMTRAIDLA